VQLILGVGCVITQVISTVMRDIFVAELSGYYRLFYAYRTETSDHAATGIWMGSFVSYRVLLGDKV